ncbi:MAG: histidine kinase [Deltaproteobacteria bacterium HGW-Deltaproteobacteria-15]|jgi:signal transduction histidine kinase|nr:MAG: histidine kinase [Deltaproteobacteria bacterium HGW-Deltaproteobacteria-15]
MKRMKEVLILAVMLFAFLSQSSVYAGDAGTKEEAVAMVKKAIEYIKANGNEKAFAELSNPKGQFVDRDLYITVYDMSAKCLVHGANPKMIGRDLIDNKDVDGKMFMRERMEIMKTNTTGWQNYKFRNPTTNQIEPKAMYLERFGDLVVACGVYVK